MSVICLRLEGSQDLLSLAEIFYRATPQITFREDGFLFLDISKCLRLYSVETFLKRCFVTLRKIDVVARVGVGKDASTALACALFGQSPKKNLPIDSLKYYVDPFHHHPETSSKVFQMVELLKSLGVRRLQDFVSIPPQELGARFGSLGLLARSRVQGESPVEWRNFTPCEVLKERHEFDLESPVAHLEPIYFKMKTLVDRMQLRLRSKGTRARQFDVILKQEHALASEEQEYKISVCLRIPSVSSKVILQVAKEKIDAQVRVQPLKARITEFSLVVTEEVPYSAAQKDLFDPRKEENEESFFRFVSRVATRLGSSAVFFAKMRESYLPEKNWQKLPELEETSESLKDRVAERPLRLRPKPTPVHFWGKHLCWDDEVDEVESLENREVVFSEWWEHSLERVYYRLTTKKGRQLWIYRTASGDFLHGEFD